MIFSAMNSVSWVVRFCSLERSNWPRARKKGGLSTSKCRSETRFSKAISRIWFNIFMSMASPATLILNENYPVTVGFSSLFLLHDFIHDQFRLAGDDLQKGEINCFGSAHAEIAIGQGYGFPPHLQGKQENRRACRGTDLRKEMFFHHRIIRFPIIYTPFAYYVVKQG